MDGGMTPTLTTAPCHLFNIEVVNCDQVDAKALPSSSAVVGSGTLGRRESVTAVSGLQVEMQTLTRQQFSAGPTNTVSFTLALTPVEDLELPVWTVGRSLSSWRGATQRLDGETCKLPSERAELIVILALKSLYNINRCGLYIMNIESITPTYVKSIWTAFKLQSVLPQIRILLAARWLTVRVQFTWSLLLLCAGKYVTKLKKD